jgi:hypothetical protein
MSSQVSNPGPAHDRRRSQRVYLRIPVAVIAPGPDKKMTREQSHTTVVNAHGALILLELPVRQKQTIILQNPETSEEQPCRVIGVGRTPEGKTEVAIELLPAPKLWRLTFPPEDWTPRAPEITSDTF